MDSLALLDRGANHPQRRTISTCSQGAGIAMCKHAPLCGHECCTVWSHTLVGRDIFGVHALGLFHKGRLGLDDRARAEVFKLVRHATSSPEGIYGGGRCVGHASAPAVELNVGVV